MSGPLAIVPTWMRSADELEVTLRTLESLRESQPDLDLLVVDDCSPATELVDEIADASSRLQFQLVRQEENAGFSTTVNVGLRRALDEGRDALLVNADMEFPEADWLDAMLADDAHIVGAKLLYPVGLVQHAGVFFSLLHRTFDHIYRFAPSSLPESNARRVCPVTGALQLIRHETLTLVGLYDQDFRMGFEDVDYCIRAFQNGMTCAYQPAALALHHESLFRGNPTEKVARWQEESWAHFKRKHATTDFGRWVPSIL